MSAEVDVLPADSRRDERAVEVIVDLGAADTGSTGRYVAGSGCMIGGNKVLTAAHVVDRGQVTVRLVGGRVFRAARVDVPTVEDIALLEIFDPAFAIHQSPMRLGRVDRASDDPVERCSAVGFPRFRERASDAASRPIRDTVHLRGVVPPRSHLVGGKLEFHVTTTPRSLARGSSEWAGLSGAVVSAHHHRHGSVVLGVVVEHHTPDGPSSLVVGPVSALVEHAAWRRHLDIAAPSDLVEMPTVPEVVPSPYRATVAELARRTEVLLGREQELDHLVSFARGTEGTGGYLWIVGSKWSGKTALMGHVVQHLPADVDVVSYFLTPKGDASSARFAAVVNDQLARLVGREPSAATGAVDAFRTQWERAIDDAEARGRYLLLVVDGLDADTSAGRDMASIASVLPRLTSTRAHVVVTTGEDPSLPADVDPAHPLYDAPFLTLSEPVGEVRQRNRAIEARHRLCPVCKLKDEAEPVPAVVGKGVPAPGSVPAVLRLPPDSATSPLPIIFGSVLIAIGLAAASGSETALVGLVMMAAGVAGIVLGLQGNARRKRLAVLTRQVWATLHYCHRDRVAFDPPSGDWSYLVEFQHFLGRRVGAAQMQPF